MNSIAKAYSEVLYGAKKSIAPIPHSEMKSYVNHMDLILNNKQALSLSLKKLQNR